MGSPFFRTWSAPKANCARGVMDLNSEVFLFRMMTRVIRLSGCSVLQKAFLRMVFGSWKSIIAFLGP